jgi:hypothetical protein
MKEEWGHKVELQRSDYESSRKPKKPSEVPSPVRGPAALFEAIVLEYQKTTNALNAGDPR